MPRKPLPEWKRWRRKPKRTMDVRFGLDNGNMCSYNEHAVDVDG